MFRNMVTSLFKYDRIKTTDTKAKELRRWADQLISLAKRGDLHARRQALAIIREKKVVHKLFEGASSRFGKRTGGYTRITKLGLRAGDAAAISLIELIYDSEDLKKKKKKKKAVTPVLKDQKAETKETKPVEADKKEPAADDPAVKIEAEEAAVIEESDDAPEDVQTEEDKSGEAEKEKEDDKKAD